MKMVRGPLTYASRHSPRPLTEDEEAALAFSAAGITGHALADLCYAPGEGGNIMNGFVGRTAGSGDGIQAVALFVINRDLAGSRRVQAALEEARDQLETRVRERTA